MGERVVVSQKTPDEKVLARAERVLRDGGVMVMPTDSVYGIGCAATPANPGLERIFEIKRRERSQTLPWLLGDVGDLSVYGEAIPDWAQRLASALWPGALTLVGTNSGLP